MPPVRELDHGRRSGPFSLVHGEPGAAASSMRRGTPLDESEGDVCLSVGAKDHFWREKVWYIFFFLHSRQELILAH